LVGILLTDDGERRLMEGFLAGRESLLEVPRQGRLLGLDRLENLNGRLPDVSRRYD
jgi:hypothetical protein